VIKTTISMGSWKILKRCPRRECTGLMLPGVALESTLRGLPDFPGDTQPVTVSEGGPGRLVHCLKCRVCGHSEAL
jgi:hypothetical protein